MNWWGSGYVTMMIYAALASVVDDSFALITESNLNILTETGQNIDIEH